MLHMHSKGRCLRMLRGRCAEVIMGHDVSSGCDIYGFGVVLYEVITGAEPGRGQRRPAGYAAHAVGIYSSWPSWQA